MRAAVLAIGTELIMGQTINSNAAEISKVLTEIGIPVYMHTSVGDNPERILESLDFLYKYADLVITTGGLGPTQDDLTREVIAQYFDVPLVEDAASLEVVTNFFSKAGLPMTENNIKQAHFPKGARIIENPVGTAPGFCLQQGNRYIAAMPGPPREMRTMLLEQIRPMLQSKVEDCFESRYVVLYGIGESSAEAEIEDLISAQTNPTIAPYAEPGQVMFRVTARGDSQEEALKLLEPTMELLRQRLGKYIVSEDGRNLFQVVPELLIQKNCSIALAESCTGGMVAAGLTDFSGISAVLDRSCVTYSNTSKIDELGVSPDTLASFGAVSEETAKEMAEGLYRKTGAKLCVSVTGIAGPDGGTEEKPVGLVCFGVCKEGKTRVFRNQFFGNRQRVRTSACLRTLDLIRKAVEIDE